MLVPGTLPTGIDYVKNPDLVDLSSLEVMDRIIAGAKARGIRIILDNHRSTPGGGPESSGLWHTGGYPESRWIEDWKFLTDRYKGNDAVIGMDLRNEPFNACWGCGDPSKDWRLAAEKAGNAILAINPDLLILVEGVAIYNDQNTWWGGNLMGVKDFPLRLQVPNRLVYSPHEYPASVFPQTWFSDPSYPNNLPAVWDRYWGYLAADTPILIGEFGTRLETEKDRQWFQALQGYVKSKRLNWTFWSLNPNSGDTGGLLLDDWTSVHQEKQAILKTIQFSSIGSGPQISFPTTTLPAPTSTPLPPPTETNTPTVTPDITPLILDDFESGQTLNWTIFHSSNSSISVNPVSPGQAGNFAMGVNFHTDAGGWSGVGKYVPMPQDWSLYQRIRFWFYGSNSGATLRLEILDNRAAGSGADTSERFEYKFSDHFVGWQSFELGWSTFTRRSDWQPAGAPDDGFQRTQIWGFNFSPVYGQGGFQLDDIQLLK
jgi:endoglucanase